MEDKEYWNDLWMENDTGWDIGHPSPPLMEFLESLKDQSIRILIPGSGNGYEAGEAFRLGFRHVFYNDISTEAALKFKTRFPHFPEDQILVKDIFNMEDKFDLILEQTSFCAQHPSRRMLYISKMHDLLKPDGLMTGVLFNLHFTSEGPPFGGVKEEYRDLFASKFIIKKMEKCYNSIIPRQEKELFVILAPK